MSSTPDKPSIPKSRKIRGISAPETASETVNNENDDEDDDGLVASDEDSPLEASTLGLYHIRTRSAPSPLKLPNSIGTGSSSGDCSDDNRCKDEIEPKVSTEQEDVGKRVHWSQSKSLRIMLPQKSEKEVNQAALAKEMQSPRFQALLRVTSGLRRQSPDIKSFSHELNSKGVRALPFWKTRALGRVEEIMATVKVKFDKLKKEVDNDLGIFAGDLVSILERTSESHPETREGLEDLLIVARQCAKMSTNEFWMKCEGIVQNLDDRRQELPMGTLKQLHTRLLFILTRCTRLVQFQKESGYEEEHGLTFHQLSDLGVYSERLSAATNQDLMRMKEKNQKAPIHIQDEFSVKDQINENDDNELDMDTAKSIASSTGSFRMSSWKKLPSAAERHRKIHGLVDSPSTDKSDLLRHSEAIDTSENLDMPESRLEHAEESLKVKKVTWGGWDQQHLAYEDSFICRICEVEIPTVHVEQHSRLCTVVDRCDLKGLTVNERLQRVSDTLERIIESWMPDTGNGSPDVPSVSASSMLPESNESSLKQNCLPHSFQEDMLDCVAQTGSTSILDNYKNFPSPAESLTPRSPLITPRTSQIDFLLSGRSTISEYESHQQVHKMLDIARSVASANNHDYSTLEYMLERLEDLKYVIQDRKVDALVVETFGRRIEKLLQEKYVSLCGQIEDEKSESSNIMGDDDSSVDDDVIRSLRASPINQCSKDRTSIEDFEIIRPISRGAFGRVFLARKRATGDLFAIKVLKKADMIRKNAVESILAERDILISLRNPFVVRFFYSFTCRENLYLVMEYLNGGDLFSLLKNLGCLEEEMARTYIAELVLALEYLHSLNVIHRDLKPDNLLIGPDGHIKVND